MPTRIELDELRGLIESGAQLIEVLPKQEYEDEHLPGAINIPIKMLDETTAARLDRSRPVVVYCYDYI
jgi:rhodanese-related sulfurtransferase